MVNLKSAITKYERNAHHWKTENANTLSNPTLRTSHKKAPPESD